MKNFIVASLVLALSQAAVAQSTVQDAAVKISKGSAVEVRLKDGQKLRGRLGEVSSSSFTLQTTKDGKVDSRDLAFDDVKSLKPKRDKGRNIALGVGLGIAGCVALLTWEVTHITLKI